MAGNNGARRQAHSVEREFPGVHVWRGVGHTGWYAARLLCSPPKVMRAPSPAGLRKKLRAERADQAAAVATARLLADRELAYRQEQQENFTYSRPYLL